MMREAVDCSLGEDEFAERQGFIWREILPAAEVEEIEDGYRLRFAADPERREQLEAFVAFEKVCCAELRFGLEEVDGQLVLEVAGDAGVKAALAGMLRQGEGGACGCSRAGGSRWARWKESKWGKSGAAVAVVSVLVCELPLVLVALGVGGAVSLGAVWEVGLIAGLSAPVVWWIWRRHRAAAVE